jgi:GNAT superfamily N-acetyltransferase
MTKTEPLSLTHLDHPALSSDLEFHGMLRGEAHEERHLTRERERVAGVLEGGGWGVACTHGLALVRPLEWDTEHFSYTCADLLRVYLTDPDTGQGSAALTQGVLDGCEERAVKLLSGRLPAGWIPTLGELTHRGARLVDTSVELGRRLPLASPAGAPDLVIRSGRPEEGDRLADIAQGFVLNRFHRDPRIDPVLARGVYRGWARSALAGRHGDLVLAEADGEVAGLASYVKADEELGVGLVALVAVHPDFRGRRVLDALMAGCEQRLGGQVMVTSTQVSNGPALRAFGRHGLLPYGARHIFHRWFDQGGTGREY